MGPARVRETTQPLTDLNTIAFKSIKLQVCYATPANGDNCHNSKVIFCFQMIISIRVLSPGDHSGCMPGAEFIQQSVTDVAVAFSLFFPSSLTVVKRALTFHFSKTIAIFQLCDMSLKK